MSAVKAAGVSEKRTHSLIRLSEWSALVQQGLAVEAATTAATTAAISAKAAANKTTAIATAAAWALHHQVNAGAGGIRLAAACAARCTRYRVAQLGAQVGVRAWWLVFKTTVAFAIVVARCAWLAWFAEFAGLTRWAWLAKLARLTCFAWCARLLLTNSGALRIGSTWVVA